MVIHGSVRSEGAVEQPPHILTIKVVISWLALHFLEAFPNHLQAIYGILIPGYRLICIEIRCMLL
jgi:hypothetical protein